MNQKIKEIEKLAMNIVYQLDDDANLNVEFRQKNNDKRIDFVMKLLQNLRSETIEETIKCVPEEKVIELEEPRLYQSNSQRNELGGYSSIPFYCSLCQMCESDIQDNKLEDGNYICNCSVWDNPMGGKWVKWSDIEEAKMILSELPSEDNAFNSCRQQTLTNLEKLKQ